jgi:hypothetical protein
MPSWARSQLDPLPPKRGSDGRSGDIHVASRIPLEAPVTSSRRPVKSTVMATRCQLSALFADSHHWAMNGSMLRLTSSMRGPVGPLA